METKLNDNEVMEIANMQRKIDTYEGFIKALFMMSKSGNVLNYPLFNGTDFTSEMNYLWTFVKNKL